MDSKFPSELANVLYTNTFPISKATGLDGTFPPAWFGTGIAYAAQEEGDQAMAAFRTAARLFPGSVLPLLCLFLTFQSYCLSKVVFDLLHFLLLFC